jgi:CRP-like cAMP-binding protein
MQTSAMAPAPRAQQVPAAARSGAEEIRLIGVTLHLDRDQEVFGEGESADQVFKVVRGAVRSFRVLSDGRRQICDFYMPGDIFGIEPGMERRATAEALTDTVLVAARRCAVLDDSDPAQARRLWTLAMADLQRSQDHALTLGRRSATERVANFLVDMAARLGDVDNLELPMTRQDMADYLGLTIETVSRTLTQLQVSGLIKLAGCRSIHLRRTRALAELCA